MSGEPATSTLRGAEFRYFTVMRSLFLRIFLLLTAAVILISMAVILAAIGTGGLRLRLPLLARSFLGDETAASASSALALYNAGGPSALSAYFDGLKETNGIEGWLIISNGRKDVLGHEIPDLVREVAKQTKEFRLPIVDVRGFQLTAAVKLESRGQPITVAFSRRIDRQPRARVIVPRSGFRYVAGLLAAILFSYILSKLIATPIEELRQSMRRYSGGTTALALPPKLLVRKDELGDLAREFDEMKERIEGLLRRQQQLVADISHELRSPLTRLAVAVEIAQDSEDREPELLERIKREASCLEALIQQLLRLAQLEARKADRNNHTVPLTDVLAGVIENAEFEAEAGGKRVAYEPPPGELLILGDEFLLASALENILRNAIRYTPPATAVTVGISSFPDKVIVSFRDHGPGVPASVLSDIFRPFYRVGDARDRDGGGAGLGLSIAQRSIMVCGGSVSARNHENGGLVVDVQLKRR